MSPKAPIVDCGPFCAVGFLRTIDKSEFSHSLGRLQSFKMMLAEFEETTLSRSEVWEESNLGKSTLSEVRNSTCSGPGPGGQYTSPVNRRRDETAGRIRESKLMA